MLNDKHLIFQNGDTLDQRLTKIAEEHNVKSWIDVNQTQVYTGLQKASILFI